MLDLTRRPKFFRFSIHKRIEGGATRCPPAFVLCFPSFSIHKRIEGGATSLSERARIELVSFQYPQADRRGCNLKTKKNGGYSDLVSVSTSGSKGVQLLVNQSWWRRACGFSIHKRIEGGATGRFAAPVPFRGVFQYPQADRRGCNATAAATGDGNRRVSVSTSGSKGVQRMPPPNRTQFLRRFSIHKRIEGGAT